MHCHFLVTSLEVIDSLKIGLFNSGTVSILI